MNIKGPRMRKFIMRCWLHWFFPVGDLADRTQEDEWTAAQNNALNHDFELSQAVNSLVIILIIGTS
jgi:hypothetical protein